MTQPYSRDKPGEKLDFRGMDLPSTPSTGFPLENPPSPKNATSAVTSARGRYRAHPPHRRHPHRLRRHQHGSPAQRRLHPPPASAAGYTYIIGALGNIYAGITGTLSAKATGFSGNPVSIVPRPNTSVQPWAYIGDSAPSPNVNIIADSFLCSGMVKARSDGLVRKMGIAEPQTAPTVTFPGGGSGPALIQYKFVYRASETGALSNPSPVSIPGTNAQSNPSQTEVAASGGVINPNITVNATQYEGNGTQIRTKGGVAVGTTTDYIIARNFGFSIPTNVTIDGVQIDLNWVGQNSGTGVLSNVALFYLGGQIGDAKAPGIQNQSFSTDTLQGSNGDTWNAALTPGIIHDSTFGFGVQITTQNSGGSERSFVNTMGVSVFYSTQDAMITPVASLDPQVNKIDIYRQGGGLANFTYVGTTPNSATAFNDLLSDLGAAANPITPNTTTSNLSPRSISPAPGIINVTSNVLTYVSGDHFQHPLAPSGRTSSSAPPPRSPTSPSAALSPPPRGTSRKTTPPSHPSPTARTS